jgi:enamine deaminase RidA (YjgF/YER057c/UK114 family)
MQKRFLHFKDQPFVVLSANGSGGKSPGEEAALAVDRIGKELERLGASLDDVVRLTVFTKNQECRPAVGEVRKKAFTPATRPASSSIIVHHFLPEDTIVEIEATALLPAGKKYQKKGIEVEPPRAYLKALRVESLVFLSGGGGTGDNIETQTGTALDRIEETLAELGSSWDKVLLLACYVKKYEWLDLVFKLARERAGSRPPPIELFLADGYANPEMLLEVEATAYL